MFKGAITALVTPFNKDLSIDLKGFSELIEWQIEHGINGILICGTTGESPTITFDEREQLIKRAVEICKDKVQLLVGTGTNCTRSSLELTRHAQDLGADGALIVSPYYNKPTQEGLYQHFKHIANNTNIPIIVYNVPGRTNVDISNETMAKLAKLDNIAGVKDCCGTERTKQIKELIGDVDFDFLTGDDPIAVEYNKNGGNGCISVMSNLLPAKCVEIQNLTAKGDFKKAAELHEKLMPLCDALFASTNPIPIKYVLSKTGLIKNHLRLPLTQLDAKNREAVDFAMRDLGLLYDLAS